MQWHILGKSFIFLFFPFSSIYEGRTFAACWVLLNCCNWQKYLFQICQHRQKHIWPKVDFPFIHKMFSYRDCRFNWISSPFTYLALKLTQPVTNVIYECQFFINQACPISVDFLPLQIQMNEFFIFIGRWSLPVPAPSPRGSKEV